MWKNIVVLVGFLVSVHCGTVLPLNEALNLEVDQPVTSERRVVPVPIFLVPQSNLKLHHGSPVGFAPAFLQLRGAPPPNVTPAVTIHPARPLFVSPNVPEVYMAPAKITVLRHGHMVPLRIKALLAPVPLETLYNRRQPIQVNTLLALPTIPHFEGLEDSVVTEDHTLISYPRPLVEIQRFPNVVASPPITHVDDSLTGKNPSNAPAHVIPAGIVQSTQPHFLFTFFHNSKESPILGILRQEAFLRH